MLPPHFSIFFQTVTTSIHQLLCINIRTWLSLELSGPRMMYQQAKILLWRCSKAQLIPQISVFCLKFHHCRKAHERLLGTILKHTVPRAYTKLGNSVFCRESMFKLLHLLQIWRELVASLPSRILSMAASYKMCNRHDLLSTKNLGSHLTSLKKDAKSLAGEPLCI